MKKKLFLFTLVFFCLTANALSIDEINIRDPYVLVHDGKLYMTWSSWSNGDYAVGAAVSENGSVRGPWKQQEEPIWPQNGGTVWSFRILRGKDILYSIIRMIRRRNGLALKGWRWKTGRYAY